MRIVGANKGYVEKNCSIYINYNPAYPAGDDGEESLTKPKIITSSLVDAYVDAEYSAAIEATGATPITWTLINSNLPEGVSFDADEGRVTGIFTEAGKYSLTVKADNPVGSKTKTVKIKVLPAKPLIITEELPMGVLREEYNIPLEAEGTDIKFSKSGSFPSGLKLDKTAGIIYGTPKKAGTYTFTITAKNKAGSDSKEFTLEINPGDPPSIDITALPDGTVKTYYETTITTSGSSPIKWTKNGTLPSGLKLNKKTGILSGTPKKAGTYKFSITATNDAGSDTKEFELVINNNAGSGNNTTSSNKDSSESNSGSSGENRPVVELEANEEITGNSVSIQTHLYLVSDDENLEGSITVDPDKALTFKIGEWVNNSGVIAEVSDVKIFIDSEEISSDIIISDDESFVLPGELVTGEFTICAKALAGSLELTTREINIIANDDDINNGHSITASHNGDTDENGTLSAGGCNISFAGAILLVLCGTMIFRKK